MRNAEPGQETLYLKPAEMILSDRPVLVTTVLGSCVSIVLHHHRRQYGAICHAMLPRGGCREEDHLRYVDCSILKMVEELRRRGIRLTELEVKLFGGADMWDFHQEDRESVGRQNIEAAREILQMLGLRITASSVGGPRGRKIHFFTGTGEVLVQYQRRLKPHHG